MTTEELIQQALDHHKADQTAEGLEILDRILQADENHRIALFARGCLRVGHEDAQNAILDWEKGLEGDLKLASALQEQYPALVEKAFYDFHFETTVEANDASVHSALGRACRLFGRFDEAIVHLTRSSELSRSAWRDGVTCAELQLKMGQTDAALANLNNLLESRQDNAELHYQVGRLYHQQGSTAFALRHLEKSVQIDPNEPRARLGLGEIYVQQGRFDQAEPQLERALKMEPSAKAYLLMAECVRGQYRFDEALQHLRSAVELEPRNLTALTELGGLALQFGDLELGVDCLKRALEIDPTRADIYGLLAKAAQQKGDAEQAIQSYRKLLELSPAESQASHNLATLLAAQGEFGEAAERLEKAREVLREDVQVTLDLAKCYLKIDRRAEALALLKESFARHPNHTETRAALHELDPTAIPVDRTLTSFKAQPIQEDHNPWLDAPDPTEPIGQPAAPAETFESLVEKARGLLNTGQEADALKAFRSALALKPKDRDCLIETGRLYARRGLVGPAADLLQQGYSLAPRDYSLLPELMNCLTQADEMERDESLAGLVLSIPADLDRKELVKALHPLRTSAVLEQLTDTVVAGILSRFPSDVECRTLWETLRQAPAVPDAETQPVVEVQPELVVDAPPVEEVHPEAVVDAPPVEEVHPEAVVDAPHVEEVHPEAVVDAPHVEEVHPEAVVDTPSVEETHPVAVVDAPSVEEAHPVAVVDAPSVEYVQPEAVMMDAPPVEEVPPEAVVDAPPVEEVHSEAVADASPVEEVPPEAAVVDAPSVEEAPSVAVVNATESLEPALSSEEEVVALEQPSEPICDDGTLAADSASPAAESVSPWTEGPPVRPEALHMQCWITQPDPSGDVVPAAPYRELARIMHSQGHLREAVYAMGQALQLEPEIGALWHAQLLADWVDYLVAHQQPEAALRVCQTWFELHPHDSQASARLHELTPAPEPEVEEEVPCENLGQALEALRTHPGNESLMKKTLELGQGNEAELMNLFRTLTRDHMDEPLHFRNFARVYLMLNKPILAVVQYQKFLVVRPTADGYRELAHAYTLLNREKNASEALKKAEELAAAPSR